MRYTVGCEIASERGKKLGLRSYTKIPVIAGTLNNCYTETPFGRLTDEREPPAFLSLCQERGSAGGEHEAGGGGVVPSVAVAQQAGVSIALIDFDAVGVTARHKHKFSVGRYHKVSRVRAR